MLRALFWKEWRQLRLVRWGGVLLGAILPIALVAGAELASRGLLPTGKTSGYRPRDIMYEILPAALGLAVWPLIALMSAAQAFGGDRAAGTERFLLERPVPRTTLWWSRTAASGATLVSVMVATAAFGAALAAVTGPPPGIGWSRWWILSGIGTGAALLAWIGGSFAASLLASPLAAVLLGAIAGGLPAVLAIEWMSVFPYARLGPVPVGSTLCAVLLPALLVSSWSASARGEPAGQGRVKRGLAITTATLAGIPIAFAAITPAALRLDAGGGLHQVDPSPTGTAAVVVRSDGLTSGGWLVGVAGGGRLRFLPPGHLEVAWSPDGTRAGFLTWSGPLGSVRNGERIDLIDGRDGSTIRSLAIPEGYFCRHFAFAGSRIVALLLRGERKTYTAEVRIARPDTGGWVSTGFRRSDGIVRFVGPSDDGRLFVQVVDWRRDASGAARDFVTHLFPVDLETATVGPEMGPDPASPGLRDVRHLDSVSPSGRYVVAVTGRDEIGYGVLDLRTSELVPAFATPRRPVWLEGDRLAWIESGDARKTLFLATVGGVARPARTWGDANVGLYPSPDGRALFVSVVTPESKLPGVASDPGSAAPDETVPVGKVPEEVLYLPSTDRVVDLSPPFSDRPNDLRYTQWAGPKTLARIAKGVVYFEDIDHPGTRRFVIGDPGDLRGDGVAAVPTQEAAKR